MNQIPQPGQMAPNFSTIDQDGKMVNLNDFGGQWIVLYFYPKDGTPGCTTEAKEFTAYYDDFTDLGATILGVSPDLPKSHCRFIAKHNLSITLLSDPEQKVTQAYGAWRLKKFMGKEYMGVARSTFLINPDKIIAHAWANVKAKGHGEEVLAKLRDLRQI